MIKCTVIAHHGAYIVKFEDGKSILLQSDYDQAQFAADCGAVKCPDNWDGSLTTVLESQAWIDCDLTDIEECNRVYYDIATKEKV